MADWPKKVSTLQSSSDLCKAIGIQHPLICGAMYPCSNPELVAAASEAGALGIIQPLSLTYVYKYDFKEGLKLIRSLTQKPVGLNLLIEASSKIYLDRMRAYLDQALEGGVKFFITALGKPDWVVKKVHEHGGLVFHDVTDLSWAKRAQDAGVDGLICVNNRAGGHAGGLTPQELISSLKPLGLPLVCAGGVGDRESYKQMLSLGYLGVQMGTRFIATTECSASNDYKQGILKARDSDIVLTEKLTGVPVSVIRTEAIEKLGTKASGFAKWALKHPRLKHWMRLYYSLVSFRNFKKSVHNPNPYKDVWQAGKSVEGIESIVSVAQVVSEFTSEQG
jgi:nitronate monooxygenase